MESLRRLRAGSREEPSAPSFEEVFRAHFERVWRTSYALVGSDLADDVTQETFLVVQRKLHEFEGASMRAWVHGITRNVARNMVRSLDRRARRNREAAERTASPASEPWDERRDAAALMDRFLARLPGAQREAFVLQSIEGFTPPEIAEAIGAPVQTVYTRLRAARVALERFRGELGEQER